MPTIDRLTRGSHPTLLEANKGNELINAINGLLAMSSNSNFLNVNVDASCNVQFDTPSIRSETFDVIGSSNAAQSVQFLIVDDA